MTRRSSPPAREGAVAERPVRRPGDAPTTDVVAVEEPLEIRVAGEALAVTMRTPGDDRALSLGFLRAEGLITTLADVGTVAHCGTPGEEGFGNVLDVTPGPGVAFDLDRLEHSRRGTLTTASCGVCGRKSVDDLLARCGPVPPGPPLPLSLLRRAPALLGDRQPVFDRTGAVHGAAALDGQGAVLAVAEDVGRHNAVDKVVGRLLLEPPGATPEVLVVSGRVSFEIVQKAVVARFRAVVAVGGASTLAIDLATRTGLCLAAFARDGRLNLYAGDVAG